MTKNIYTRTELAKIKKKIKARLKETEVESVCWEASCGDVVEIHPYLKDDEWKFILENRFSPNLFEKKLEEAKTNGEKNIIIQQFRKRITLRWLAEDEGVDS